MPRDNTQNRFTDAGKNLVGATKEFKKNDVPEAVTSVQKKDKVVTAKVYPETWADFTAINKILGMTNNSAINMLISNYIIEKKSLIKK